MILPIWCEYLPFFLGLDIDILIAHHVGSKVRPKSPSHPTHTYSHPPLTPSYVWANAILDPKCALSTPVSWIGTHLQHPYNWALASVV